MDVNTIFVDMPVTISGYTIRKGDDYTIVLNSKLSHEKHLETYAHELDHITNGDFEKFGADLIELHAHK